MNRQRNSGKALRVLTGVLSATSAAVGAIPEAGVEAVSVQSALPSRNAEWLAQAKVLEGATDLIRSDRPAVWTKAQARRFDDLSAKEAIGRISPEELAELELLSQDRRRLLFPRTADEILIEIRQRDALANLMKALDACAQVIPADR